MCRSAALELNFRPQYLQGTRSSTVPSCIVLPAWAALMAVLKIYYCMRHFSFNLELTALKSTVVNVPLSKAYDIIF